MCDSWTAANSWTSSPRGDWIYSKFQMTLFLCWSWWLFQVRSIMFHDGQQSSKSKAGMKMGRMVETIHPWVQIHALEGPVQGKSLKYLYWKMWLGQEQCVFTMLYLYAPCVYTDKNSEGSGDSGAAVIPAFGRLRQEITSSLCPTWYI